MILSCRKCLSQDRFSRDISVLKTLFQLSELSVAKIEEKKEDVHIGYFHSFWDKLQDFSKRMINRYWWIYFIEILHHSYPLTADICAIHWSIPKLWCFGDTILYWICGYLKVMEIYKMWLKYKWNLNSFIYSISVIECCNVHAADNRFE